MVDGIRGFLNLCSLLCDLCVLLRLFISNAQQGNLRVLGIANPNGDSASWSRHAGNLRRNFPACRHEEPNGTVAATKFLGYWLSAIKSMWLRIVTLIRKEVLAVFRDPRNRAALILPPILQLFLFSFTGTLEVKHVRLGVWNQDYGQVANELIERLSASPNFDQIEFAHSRKELQHMIDDQRVLLAMNFQPDFTRKFQEQKAAPLQLIADGRKSNASQIAQGYVIQVVNQFVSEQGQSDNGATVQIVQRNWLNPNLDYIWFTLPSLAVMITLQICLNVTAMSVAREREMGTFDQLLVSPMQPLEIMAGKSIPALILGLIEVTIFILITVFLFRIPFHGSVPFLYLSLTVFITAMIGIGLSISSIAVTQQQALLGIMTILLPAVLLFGDAAPIANIASWLATLTYVQPPRYIIG